MSDSTAPRIIRKRKPKKKYTQNTYRKSLPYLLEDFNRRCAYSLQHVDKVGMKIMEVDHFNPTLKNAARHRYENLLPATRHCNGSKGQAWPSKEARKQRVRFLNPCVEADYGVQIFEDPNTHELVGTSPAARFHIRVLALNAPFLVNERKERAQLRNLLAPTVVTITNETTANAILSENLAMMDDHLARMIPPIDPPPTYFGNPLST